MSFGAAGASFTYTRILPTSAAFLLIFFISTESLRDLSNGRSVLAPVITQNEEYNHWSRLEQVFRLGVCLACFGCRFGRYCSITCTNLANRGESSLEAGTKRKSIAGKRTPKRNQAAGPKYDGILVDSNHCETFAIEAAKGSIHDGIGEIFDYGRAKINSRVL